MTDLTLDDLHRGFETSTLTSTGPVRAKLDRIHEINHLVKAIAEIDPTALQQAETLDAERAGGKARG